MGRTLPNVTDVLIRRGRDTRMGAHKRKATFGHSVKAATIEPRKRRPQDN
jgi:hypothetical protein